LVAQNLQTLAYLRLYKAIGRILSPKVIRVLQDIREPKPARLLIHNRLDERFPGSTGASHS